MKNITIILFVIFLGLTQAIQYCCQGTYDSRNSISDYTGISRLTCPSNANDKCITNTPAGSYLTTLNCADDSTTATNTCENDYCNCPPGFQQAYSQNEYGEMKKIMFPVMGMVFGVIWVVLALVGRSISADIMLTVVGLIDAVFGIFLIFIPVVTFLGLFYIAIGALSIALARHFWGGDRGIDFYLALTTIIFLLTGGLTFVAFDFGRGVDYFNRVAGYMPFCDRDMNIITDGGYSTRCGNYAFFVAFCVYLLFLIQPIALIFAAFKRVDHHQDTTVVVNEKHKK